MEIRQINSVELDQFVGSQTSSQLLQSSSWSRFQKEIGHQAWSLGVFLNNELISTASIISHPLPMAKSFLYCPRGPVFKNNLAEEKRTEALKLILSKARDITIATGYSEEIFFRLEPLEETGLALAPTQSIQPATTLILDLKPGEKELLKSMHSKTRYNIRLAEKHGITVRRAANEEFNLVWKLFEQTAKRDRFRLHSESYYQKMLELDEIELWIASNENDDIISANLIGFYGDTATFLHGASDYHHRQLMAPYLLQWTAIKEAEQRNFRYYDFHGLAPEGQLNHPWAGVTRYKKGFGGEVKNYPGTFDFVYQPGWYQLYKVFRKLNRLMR